MCSSKSIERNTSTDKPQLSKTDKKRAEDVATSRRIKLERLQKMRLDIKHRIESTNKDGANSNESIN